jgi:outer membrane lipoprotein-sorting protein
MSISKFAALVVCAAALAVPLSAAHSAKPDSLDDVIQKVQLAQKNTNTLQADFRQEKTLALLAKPEVSTGRFVYLKPNNVLWTYDAPKRVTLLIADGMLTTYYPDLNRAERIEVKRYQDQIFKYLGASGTIDELGAWFNFTFTNTADKPYYVLDLDPKTKGVAKRVRHLRVYIDRKTYLTTQLEYTEGDGDKTRYEFLNVKTNAPVEQSRFSIAIPSNVRVEQMKLQ